MADALSFMFESQAIVAAKVDELTGCFVEPRRGMPRQTSTSEESSPRGATCLFLQFARTAAAMHFGAVKRLLPFVW
jgi:hypothetical protein